jgi:hypothetical protein
MPGKYPTINSPLTTRTTLAAGGTAGLSNSDKSTLGAMFPNSPIYSFNETDYRALAKGYLQPDTQSDTTDYPHFAAPVDMNYGGSPDLSTPPDGFDSSYYPNLIANSDPAGGEGTATGVPLSPNDNFGTGTTVDQVLPSATAAIISQSTIESTGPIAPSGQSGANLSTGAVTTHTINEGADGV